MTVISKPSNCERCGKFTECIRLTIACVLNGSVQDPSFRICYDCYTTIVEPVPDDDLTDWYYLTGEPWKSKKELQDNRPTRVTP